VLLKIQVAVEKKLTMMKSRVEVMGLVIKMLMRKKQAVLLKLRSPENMRKNDGQK